MIKNNLVINENNEMFINNIRMDNEHPIVKEFNNFAEVGDWWSANPTAVRINPATNDGIVFPCSMTFVFPAA